MKQNRYRNNISYILLALFLATKLVGLHVITHSHDKDYLDHCAICHNIASDSHAPVVFVGTDEFILHEVEFVPQKEVSNAYDFQISSNPIPSLLFSRPPPSILFLG